MDTEIKKALLDLLQSFTRLVDVVAEKVKES